MKKLLFLILILLENMVLSQNNVSINYKLIIQEPSSHVFEVSINFSNLNEGYLDLKLPVWRPGRYLIFDFSSGIFDFNAYGIDSTRLKWKKIDKSTWRVESDSINSLNINYKVYANEFYLRTRGLNENHAFIDGTSVFMFSEKFRYEPLTLEIEPYKDWHVTTGLTGTNDSNFEFISPGYDVLADSPLEIGKQTDFDFFVDGKKHIISISGDANYNKDTLINDFIRIIKKEIEFWGIIPYDKYVFLIECSHESGGGTEHLNSSIEGVKPEAFNNPDSYKNFLRLISHEFFHTWNVKQLRPKGLTPYDYSKENYTEELWIAEGSTSYYDGLIVLRTGQISTEDFFNEIIRSVDEDRNKPGNKVQSLAESSFDAWVKFWKFTEQRRNIETDYYGKGADVSLLLDLELRKRTNNKVSLDDVFKNMFQKFPLGTGYTNNDFKAMCDELSGSDFQSFFDDYVYGVKPLEWEKSLLYAGLELYKDTVQSKPSIGLKTGNEKGKIVVVKVDSGSFADNAGLKEGDKIIALDGEKIKIKKFNEKLDTLRENDKIIITVFRKKELKEFTLFMKPSPKYKLRKINNPTDLQKSIYSSWLGNQY